MKTCGGFSQNARVTPVSLLRITLHRPFQSDVSRGQHTCNDNPWLPTNEAAVQWTILTCPVCPRGRRQLAVHLQCISQQPLRGRPRYVAETPALPEVETEQPHRLRTDGTFGEQNVLAGRNGSVSTARAPGAHTAHSATLTRLAEHARDCNA